MIIDAFKNKIFPKVPTGFEDDDDKGLRPDSPDSSFSTTNKSDKSDESDFTADDLDKMYIGNPVDRDKLLLDTEKYLDPDLIQSIFLRDL